MGGMGEIHLAHDAMLGRRVVIKYLLDHAATDRERVEMFLHEARAVALCEHPNIIRIFDVGLDRGRYFMALEHLEGWDLADILTRMRETQQLLPLPIALRLIIDAAEGLHAAHEAASADGEPLRLVHRDVSLHNLFVTRAGLLKVLDFGVAKTDAQVHSTMAGTLKGTLAYMSPEQCSAVELDRRSDVFSLGVVAYELVSGQRLFKRETSQEIVAAVVQAYVPPPARPIGEELLVTLRRALARDREVRFATTHAFAEALATQAVASRADVAEFMATHMADATAVDAAPLLAPPMSQTPTPAREATTPTVDLDGKSEGRKRRGAGATVAAVVVIVSAMAVGAFFMRAPSKAPPTVADARVTPPAAPVMATPEPPPEPVAAKVVATPKPAKVKAAPVRGEGLLTLDSEPWADVYVNGTLVGQTPLVRHEVAAGRLRLRLENKSEKLTYSETVDMKSGGNVRLVVDLQKKSSRVLH